MVISICRYRREKASFIHNTHCCCFQQFIFILNSIGKPYMSYFCLGLISKGGAGIRDTGKRWHVLLHKNSAVKIVSYSCDKLIHLELSAVKFYMPELTCQSANSHMVLIWWHSTDANRMWEVSGSFPLILSAMLPVHMHSTYVCTHLHTHTLCHIIMALL